VFKSGSVHLRVGSLADLPGVDPDQLAMHLMPAPVGDLTTGEGWGGWGVWGGGVVS
jgi:hypothetical protein